MGGMRGIIGSGTNRLNVYTMRKAAYGLARNILKQGEQVAAEQGTAVGGESQLTDAVKKLNQIQHVHVL